MGAFIFSSGNCSVGAASASAASVGDPSSPSSPTTATCSDHGTASKEAKLISCVIGNNAATTIPISVFIKAN